MELIQANRLSSDYVNSLPIIRFEGRVVTVADENHADEVLTSLMDEPYLGFDTESKPSFTKGTIYPVSLIQVATSDTAYLFQLKKTGFSDKMVRFLSSEDVKKIGVGLKNDLTKLLELRTFTPGGFIDLSKLALDKGIIQVGIRGLTARYMGFRLTKAAQKTNWAQTVLTAKQQLYAASDAWVCLKIYPCLISDTTDYRIFNEEEKKTGNNEPNQVRAAIYYNPEKKLVKQGKTG
jgi:ribonuclease D